MSTKTKRRSKIRHNHPKLLKALKDTGPLQYDKDRVESFIDALDREERETLPPEHRKLLTSYLLGEMDLDVFITRIRELR